jgi:hypothetical protein
LERITRPIRTTAKATRKSLSDEKPPSRYAALVTACSWMIDGRDTSAMNGAIETTAATWSTAARRNQACSTRYRWCC